FIALLIQLSLWIIDFLFKSNLSNYKFPIVNIPIYYVAIPLGISVGYGTSTESHTKSKENRAYKTERLESLVKVRKLFVECENYNSVIRSIELKDKISKVLEHVNDPLRDDVIKTLNQIRNNLEKALKVERLLRENLDVVNIETEHLEITFAEIQFTDIKNYASQYSEFVEDVLTIGTNLNREFKMLDNSKNS
ncbi:MAG: hypothetical protein PUP93_13785, partial [Rhizonema sp. NSF051]|nr:hypothetical protein [Rhizonema sp. NSF051]